MREQFIEKRFRADALALIEHANTIIAEYRQAGYRLTLRQLYYQFVSRDLMANKQQNYDRLGATISDARLAGLVDWDAIEDRTRNLQRNSHWSSPRQIVGACAEQYEIDKWANQAHRVEVWVEKDALIGVLQPICEALDVPYFACRGYVSQSEMYSASKRVLGHVQAGQDVTIFHLGDHDPSGIDMSRDIAARMALMTGLDVGSRAADDWISVQRIALNYDQIEAYKPPPNPAKTTDVRFDRYNDKYGNMSWELDALQPQTISTLIRDHVIALRDQIAWEHRTTQEIAEQSQLQRVADNWDQLIGG